MREQIRIAVPSFTLALLAGFYFTFQMTGSENLAVERMITIIVLWMACALTWNALCMLIKLLVQAASDRSLSCQGQRLTFGHLDSER